MWVLLAAAAVALAVWLVARAPPPPPRPAQVVNVVTREEDRREGAVLSAHEFVGGVRVRAQGVDNTFTGNISSPSHENSLRPSQVTDASSDLDGGSDYSRSRVFVGVPAAAAAGGSS